MRMTDQVGTPSFARDIEPLFRMRDQMAMRRFLDLGSHRDVSEHAPAILARLANGTMPCDGKWPDERVALFRRWVDAGMPG